MKNKKYSKNILLVVLLVAIAASIYYYNSQKVDFNQDVKPGSELGAAAQDYIRDEDAIKEKSAVYPWAPELTGIVGYLNTDSNLTIGSLRGKVVLVDFWTYTCINCIRTLPYLKSWHDKYSEDGLVIVGVHTPEFEFEKKYENVKDAVEKYDLKYAIVQDNDYLTWRAYKNRFWPHKYLIDVDGFIVYDHIGEGAYEETEELIQKLLNERKERVGQEKVDMGMSKPSGVIDVDYRRISTPEIYLGYAFSRGNFGNKEGLKANEIIDYEFPGIVSPGKAYLDGRWKINSDNSELIGDEGRIVIGYNAKAVNIVAGSSDGSEVEVLHDTNPLTDSGAGFDVEIIGESAIVKIKDERLYNIVDYEYDTGLLELKISGKGFKIYTFTFG